MKSYNIVTTKDILEAVTSENIDGFLKDFEGWLRFLVELKKEENPFIKLSDSTFTWNDDGEYGKMKSVKFVIRDPKEVNNG